MQHVAGVFNALGTWWVLGIFAAIAVWLLAACSRRRDAVYLGAAVALTMLLTLVLRV